jgi:type IV pilus assembly protein PilN
MMQFNLLPYRAQQRRRHRQHFYCMLLLAALLGGALTGIGWYGVGRQQQAQQTRNQLLQQMSSRLGAEIKHAAALQHQIDALAAGIGKIETWQRQRGRTTSFLTILAAQIPSAQQDQKITLDGYATSNLAVAELLQNLNAQSDDIASAQLLETRAAHRHGAQALAFSVALTLRQRP